MTIIEAKQLFRYTSWANAAMFEAAAALPAGQADAPIASSFPSVSATLAHLAGAEWVWLRRWLGEAPASMPGWVARPELEEARQRLREVETERARYLEGLADADLAKVVDYRLFNGKASSAPLAELMRHVANHSTYHRGQAATQLRQLGQAPPSTDYIRYVREAAAPDAAGEGR